MRRRVVSVLALVGAWITFGLIALAVADNEASRCHQFGNLGAECFAPFGLSLAIVSLIFIICTVVLFVLALRTPSGSERT